MKTFAIMTLGCKVNDYESAYVKNKLSEEYEMVDFKEKSDIYIIFSCCVTNTAEAQRNMTFTKERFVSANYEGPYAVKFTDVSVAGTAD